MKIVIVDQANTFCPTQKIQDALEEKYPGATIWYRETKDMGGALEVLGASDSKSEMVLVDQYRVWYRVADIGSDVCRRD